MRRLVQFESKHQPMLSLPLFLGRVARNIIAGFLIISFFLGIGIVGYRVTCGFEWLDCLLNASMILSGMGPIATDTLSVSGKWFASFYALLSGVVFISTIGLILAPVAHRIFHRFHIESEEEEDNESTKKKRR